MGFAAEAAAADQVERGEAASREAEGDQRRAEEGADGDGEHRTGLGGHFQLQAAIPERGDGARPDQPVSAPQRRIQVVLDDASGRAQRDFRRAVARNGVRGNRHPDAVVSVAIHLVGALPGEQRRRAEGLGRVEPDPRLEKRPVFPEFVEFHPGSGEGGPQFPGSEKSAGNEKCGLARSVQPEFVGLLPGRRLASGEEEDAGNP